MLNPIKINKSLEPIISDEALKYHYNYYLNALNKLNQLIGSSSFKSADAIIANIATFNDNRDDILYYASSVKNHEMYFNNIGNLNKPSGKLLDKINSTYESYDNFKAEFKKTASKLVGSGYTYLVMDKNGLKIINTSNEDNPITYGFIPLFNIDLFEHAYFLDYHNNRNDYIDALFSIADFTNANEIYKQNQ